jgi:hypothetical protein
MRGAEFIREHLHVPRQHHQICLILLDQFQQPGLRLGFAFGGDRHVVEGKAGGFGHRAKIGVVGHYGDEFAAEIAAAPPEDQVVETVPHLGHHHQ